MGGRRKTSNIPPGQRRPALQPAADKLDLAAAAKRAADDTEVRAALAEQGIEPPANDDKAVLSAYDELLRQASAYERAAAAARERTGAAADAEAVAREREQLAADARAAAEADRRRLAAAEDELKGRLSRFTADEAHLKVRGDEVTALEREARDGFAAQARAARLELEAELDLRRQTAQLEAEQQRRQLAEEHAKQTALLERDRAALRRSEEELRFEKGALRGQQILLERKLDDLDKEIQARAAADIAALDRDLQVLRIQHDAQVDTIAELRKLVSERDEQLLRVGGTDPRYLIDERDRLAADNAELRGKLAERLSDDDHHRLRWLEQQYREAAGDRDRLAYRVQELEADVLAGRINNLQMKQLSDAEAHYALLTRGYESRIAELQGVLEQLTQDRPDPGTPLFPRCVAMDDDPLLSERGAISADRPDLSRLARSLQTVMFADSQRAYRLNDVCVLLGGLAMSRLHLLEGMSGIGKTSLPVALAKALGTECAVVEVQAGWRDRTDLFGHHNTFERRFEESEFLQALYLAQTPRYRERPFFIVLDEMNLARPEQYFSVLLSQLERAGAPIQLVTRGAGRAPKGLVNGTHISLPDNVWFIGTANQDESTLEFADKTYNRSHVMELPAQRPWLASHGTIPDIERYSAEELRRTFREAKRQHISDVREVRGFLGEVADDLREHGRLVVAPRLQRQLEMFVPVVVAAHAGNPVEERPDAEDAAQDGRSLAADHFLARKVLRSLRGRYDVTPGGLGKIRDTIRTAWELCGLSGVPVRCVALLDDEQRRREG
ncbi:AAA family ATPase [Dactylosporangium vinaceum]|uniref:AAA family ATPase n=1 Tax=Dactylosporangium vinaceum TaxID=53362 RepID=A0ABV5M3N4_9ACTN|nr:AAA family ATPase [Dactylosporangium vinaceum]UAB94433.1 AAA family ATPase [Dactylosporangium vinaceum]